MTRDSVRSHAPGARMRALLAARPVAPPLAARLLTFSAPLPSLLVERSLLGAKQTSWGRRRSEHASSSSYSSSSFFFVFSHVFFALASPSPPFPSPPRSSRPLLAPPLLSAARCSSSPARSEGRPRSFSRATGGACAPRARERAHEKTARTPWRAVLCAVRGCRQRPPLAPLTARLPHNPAHTLPPRPQQNTAAATTGGDAPP